MPDLSVQTPALIESATKSVSDKDLMTLAAFLLAAGIWHQRLDDQDPSMLPNDDLQPLGLKAWRLIDEPEPGRLFNLSEVEWRVGPDLLEPTDFHVFLGALIWRAFTTRRSVDLARAVSFGTNSPDALVRICAITSAFEMFKLSRQDRIRMLTNFEFTQGETSTVIAQMLLAKTFDWSISASGSGSVPPPRTSPSSQPGLILIHGTNFPPNRPIWSVPRVGSLFKHIANFRKDIYGRPDYFRWEGGYSDYAREVASLNLYDWVDRRKLTGIDAVTHSHGGNVLMAATKLQARFGKVVFLSCPVRWAQYQPRANSIKGYQSVRIHFDFVIAADRASQRFPRNTIPEHVLPIWFLKHGVTYEPKTWKTEALDGYIR